MMYISFSRSSNFHVTFAFVKCVMVVESAERDK